MEKYQFESDYESKRLQQTIALAQNQLDQAKRYNEDKKAEIIAAKKEMRENTSHSISNLYSSDDFEALAELSQYANPVTEKIADYEEMENKIFMLETLMKSPYFARIDFKFEDEDTFEEIYIGRSSLKKNSSYEMSVYDWRTPIASVFYRFALGEAFYDAPGGRIKGQVNLKRQYEIEDGVLEYFFDADVQIVDEFLRKLLSQNASAKMKTIVETIQKEQDIVIRDLENDLMMVQGVAGSGKTSIALHRAAYLMYQGATAKLSVNNIMIISPNTLFEQYISNVLPELGERNVASVVFEELMEATLQVSSIQSKNRFLENLITNTRYHKIIKAGIEWKTSRRFLEILNRFIDDIPHNWIEFDDIYFAGKRIARKEILKAKVSGRPEVPLGVKLRQLEELVLEEAKGSKKKRIHKEEELTIRNEIQKFTEIDIIALYRKLVSDKKYFYSLTEGCRLCEGIEDILEYTEENLSTNLLYYDDAVVLTYMHIKIYGTSEYKNIKQVVIDEAQDYYPLQYEIFKRLFQNAKFTVLGDMNQTLQKQEDMSFYEEISSILDKKKASLITMDKSFRCTNEILNFSLKFIDQNLEIKSFNRKGEQPRVYAASDKDAHNEMIVGEIKDCLKEGYQSVGLICKTEKNANSLFQSLRDKIDVELIKDQSMATLQGVFIIPVYMSKGLEFDAVLICDADRGNYNNEGYKNFLYIECTRALHRLNLFCEGDISPFLAD